MSSNPTSQRHFGASLPRSSGRSAQAGFTLIETIVGLSILLIGTLGLVAAIVTSLQAGRVAREHTLALAKAQEQMDDLMTLSETELLVRAGETFVVDGLEQRTDGTPLGQIDVDMSAPPLYGVAVTIRWQGPYGNEALSLDSTVLPD